MKRLMVCGSRSTAVLPPEFKRCLDKAVGMKLEILIGDAPGVDKAAQIYLAGLGYRKVVVYVSKSGTRNNVGNWAVKEIMGGYETRDEIMSQDANWLLALWDGTSRGTGSNINRFAMDKRKVFYTGINIYSGTKGLGGALTNPTELAFQKRSVRNHYPITFRGKQFPDAEAAYQAHKQGNDSDRELMVEVLVEKLSQYPILIEKISDRGGTE